MISDQTISELRALVCRISPELSAAPFYVLTPPRDYPLLPNIRALTHKGVDYKIRRAQIDSGEWDGPGTTIILNPNLLTDHESIVGAFIHECSHNVPATAPPSDHEPSDEEAARQVELIGLWATLPADAPSDEPPWFPWHDSQFIRRCLHLRHRAALVGIEVALPAIQCSGSFYGTSQAWKYLRAIGDEPARMLGATFSEIERTELPSAFVELWESDVAAWNKKTKGTNDICN